MLGKASPLPGRHDGMKIRDARAGDALAACRVLRRSIIELCVADHRNDPAILGRWLSNKTPEMFRSWITQSGRSLLVAVEGEDILTVGCVTDAGEVTLNYVSPDARFRGVSRGLLGALEARAVQRGNVRCSLTSTETALRFYSANGYVENGTPTGAFGMDSGYPMSKALTSCKTGAGVRFLTPGGHGAGFSLARAGFMGNVFRSLIVGEGTVREGGCLCGDIRYRVEGRASASGICHCESCRRAASAPTLPFVVFAREQFTLARGVLTVFESSAGVTRAFCGRCGSLLTYRNAAHPETIDVMTCSLDDPGSFPPTCHVWFRERISWIQVADGLPCYPADRSAGLQPAS